MMYGSNGAFPILILLWIFTFLELFQKFSVGIEGPLGDACL